MDNLLPDSRPKVQRNIIKLNGANWCPIFCANCGKDGGLVPEENMTFAFYLCESCAEKWSPLVDTYMVPDEVFWQKVREEKNERALELLNRDRPSFDLIKMS